MISFEEYIRIRETILSMIEKRGFNPEFINRDINEDRLMIQYEHASTYTKDSDKDRFACDIFIKKSETTEFTQYENRQMYVHFVLDDDATYTKILANIEKIEKIYDLKKVDDIAIIICHKTLDENSRLFKLQKENTNIFHYKNLAFDITKHRLVPPHIKIKDYNEKLKIKKNLQIDCFSKLPTLLHTDAISKFYHFRRGDLIKIIRPSNFGSLTISQNGNDFSSHTVYRYVV